jgi:hypothetical protein
MAKNMVVPILDPWIIMGLMTIECAKLKDEVFN